MSKLQTGRRDFLKTAGFISGTALLTACTISSPDIKIGLSGVLVENKTQNWVADFSQDIMWAIAAKYKVPEEAKNYFLDIQLLPDKNFSGGADIGVAIDSGGEGAIKIATGYYEEEVRQITGHLPQDIKDSEWVSIRTSGAILHGYCQIAALRNLLPSDQPKKIESNYVESIIKRGENLELIIFMQLKQEPTTPSSGTQS